MDTVPERLALLEKNGFFRFFNEDDPSIIEFATSESTVLQKWGIELEAVIKQLGELLVEWAALIHLRSEIIGGFLASRESELAVFSERISGITFFGKDDPDFNRTELREVLYYVIYGQPASFNNVSLFDYWIESGQLILDKLSPKQVSEHLIKLRTAESKFYPVDGYSKYPRMGLRFWQRAIDLAQHTAQPQNIPATTSAPTAPVYRPTKSPAGDMYSYLKGVDVESFKGQLCHRGILNSSLDFIPRKNTVHKLTHILALPYILKHLGVISDGFFDCTQLERVDIYTASFSIRFGRNILSDLAVTDFITQLENKDRNDVAWAFYNEVTASVDASRLHD
ncbi:hypothetical protein [Dyadobacter chenhuakuii]|uniref:Uncharacterized protein n=1 Tax=Dyadobacter chenhuakuii TaxID=2909339 RepID=A0A9X1QGL8_9BACT|nr:hypothetical protein [Dyadobacter chenhuakuii]MCF2496524.1 hypothetical protein [Dyadobacter chenhuakuii]MCF2501568.1 hypothetical protein [Dyadobacter chenhuakuii]USJ30581.1 hypothetical protein NFI80_22315 [Dyadobacter chenhuakuii]